MDNTIKPEELDILSNELEKYRIPENDINKEELDNDLVPELVTGQITSEGFVADTIDALRDDKKIISLENISDKNFKSNIISQLIELTKSDEVLTKYSYFGITDLSDEDINMICNAYADYIIDNNEKVYTKLPESIKSIIKRMNYASNNFNFNTSSIKMLDMIYNEYQVKFKNAIDIQDSVNDSIGVPSITDIYMENIKFRMTTALKQIAEEHKEDNPEKSNLLLEVSDMFENTYTLKLMYDTFNNNSKARKAMRRDNNLVRLCNEFNYKNEKSMFKMTDCTQMIKALHTVLIEDAKHPFYYNIDEYNDDSLYTKEELVAINMKTSMYSKYTFTEDDISKFLILFFKTCENFDSRNLLESTYMYYSMRNISVLSYSQEAKTPFAAELISNIKELLIYIREKEEEFNANKKH